MDVASENSNSFFLEHQLTPFGGLIGNRREISICSKIVLIPELRKGMNKNALFFQKKLQKAKIKFLQC